MPVDPPGTSPGIPPGLQLGTAVGSAFHGVASTATQTANQVSQIFVPDWLGKAGTYLTDRGTLIRIGTFIGGGILVLIAFGILFGRQAVSVGKDVAKVVV